ncbi:MAG: restriction endonuclease [Gammaproteobacteria bacterium]
MANVTWERTGTLLRKLFEILQAEPDGLPARLALERLSGALTLTEHEAGMYADGNRRFEKIVRFSTIDCVKAGWLLKNKGTWSVTDAGRVAFAKFTEPAAFHKEATRLYWQWKKAQPAIQAVPIPSVESEPTDELQNSATITFEEAEEQAWGEIEVHLSNMDPYEFQKLVADLLKAMGYYPTWVAPPGPDGGLDIIAYPDPLGTRPPRIKVQVKRQQQRISTDGVRSFIALVNEDDAGLFVSLGGFTRDAQDFARMQERRKITLIDLERLVDLWIEFYPKLDSLARERLPLTPIYFLTPRA